MGRSMFRRNSSSWQKPTTGRARFRLLNQARPYRFGQRSTTVVKPDSTDPSFEPIVLEGLEEGELTIVAELVEVLG